MKMEKKIGNGHSRNKLEAIDVERNIRGVLDATYSSRMEDNIRSVEHRTFSYPIWTREDAARLVRTAQTAG
jgi:hypothetical protein